MKREDIVKAAVDTMKDRQLQTVVVGVFEAKELMEFPGRSGWTVWVRVKSELFGEYERPIEVDGETLEAKLVPYML